MLPKQIRAHFEPVENQLLTYDYHRGPRSDGQSKALRSADRWVKTILGETLKIAEPAVELVHVGDAGTCDVVQHRIVAWCGREEWRIEICQTVFVVAIVVTPPAPLSNLGRTGKLVVSAVGRQLFRNAGRLNFQTTHEMGWITLGKQAAPAGRSPDEEDWLDTIAWWTDGDHAGFFLLKQAAPNQSSHPSLSLEANRTWFSLFERARTRS